MGNAYRCEAPPEWASFYFPLLHAGLHVKTEILSIISFSTKHLGFTVRVVPTLFLSFITSINFDLR